MMVVISPTIGVILILIGIAFFIVDLSATKHGLPTAGGILTLLAGGLALLGAGVPYSGMLLGAVVVVAMLMGACFSGSWVRCAPSEGGPSLPARRE
jgi:membrane-bound ClpP family serine protease